MDTITVTAVCMLVATVLSSALSVSEQVTVEEEIWTLTVVMVGLEGEALISVITNNEIVDDNNNDNDNTEDSEDNNLCWTW